MLFLRFGSLCLFHYALLLFLSFGQNSHAFTFAAHLANLRPDGKSGASEDWAQDSYLAIDETVIAPSETGIDSNVVLGDRHDGSEAEVRFTFENVNTGSFTGDVDNVQVHFHASRYKNVPPIQATLYFNGNAKATQSFLLPSGHEGSGDWFTFFYASSTPISIADANSIEVGFLAPELVTTMEIYINVVYVEIRSDLDESNADYVIAAEYQEDQAGYEITSVGDVNDDDYDDFIIGSHYKNFPTDGWAESALFFGRNSSYPSNVSGANGSFHWLGWAEEGYHSYGVGDVNGDNYSDFIVAAHNWSVPSATVSVGTCLLIYGGSGGWPSDVHPASVASATMHGRYTGDSVGYSGCGVGDVNADGYDDFLVIANGWEGQTGAAFLFLGSSYGISWVGPYPFGDQAFLGVQEGERLGRFVSGKGDINGDGYDDFLLGCDQYHNGTASVGRTAIILGNASGASFSQFISGTTTLSGGQYGVGIIGDINDDGRDDFLIDDSLFFGRTGNYSFTTSGRDVEFITTPQYVFASLEINKLKDLNEDGIDDFSLGYGFSYGVGLFETFIFYGREDWPTTMIPNITCNWKIKEETAGEANNFKLDSGDFNGDGSIDIIVGMDGAKVGGSSYGKAFIFLNH
jgi:hypothetical protein